jgi:hypothetical protein
VRGESRSEWRECPHTLHGNALCLSGVGHVDASGPQALLGRHLRVDEGELLLPALLANRLQKEVCLCVSAETKGRNTATQGEVVP